MKHLEPTITRCVVNVEIPVRRAYTLCARTEMKSWVELFKKMADETEWFEEKYDMDRCRCIVEWAEICGATMERVFQDEIKIGHVMVMVLKFTDYDNLEKFKDGFSERIKK